MPLSVHLGASVLLLFCISSPVMGELEEISVEISSKNVILSCPGEESWWEGRKENGNSLIITSEELDKIRKGEAYICKQNSQSHKSRKIFLKIKVCEDCVELSFSLGASIIAADLLLTLGVLLLVYFCCKKQYTSGAGLERGGTPGQQQGQPGDLPPPVPNPDYEPIRKGREVYAGLEPRAF